MKNIITILITLFSAAFFSCGDSPSESDFYADYDCADDGKCVLKDKKEESSTQQGSEYISCEAGFGLDNSLTKCLKFNSGVSDLKTCKAADYGSTSKIALSLSDKIWCGDLPGRFNKKAGMTSGEFVYDNLLRGFWSQSKTERVTWDEASKYCSQLGGNWQLPSVYQLLSLFISQQNSKAFHINSIFSETGGYPHWSLTADTSIGAAFVWVLNFNNASIGSMAKANTLQVRCFKSE